MNFWQKLSKPFTALAPMHDVTDTAFRQTVIACGRPDVLYTEFVSIDGLLHEKSQKRIVQYYLQFTEIERPIVAQIWGNDPKKFSDAAKIIESLGYDGVDINMGCPDKKVVAMGGGAGHMLEQEKAIACIKAAQDATTLPISVKTRLGFDEVDLKWIEKLMQSDIPALAVHLRTKKELSKAPAHWELVDELNKLSGRERVLLIGNGDWPRLNLDHLDGVIVGRGILGNPWFFSESGKPEKLEDRLKILKLHAELFEKHFLGIKSFAMLKKHIRGYVGSFHGAKNVREWLMDCKSIDELIAVCDILIA